MGQTLTHGVYLPDEGERNCYSGLAANWQILDNSVGTIAANTAALAGKAPLVHTHTVSQITDFPAYGNAAGTICEGNDSRLSDARTPTSHTHGSITNDGKLGTASVAVVTDANKNISVSSVTATELGYLSGVTSAIQTQISGKAPAVHTHVTADVTDLLTSAHTWAEGQTIYSYANIQSQVLERAVTPANTAHVSLNLRDKNNHDLGIFRSLTYSSSGSSIITVFGVTQIKDRQVDPTGTVDSYGFTETCKSDGTKYFTFDGYMGSNLEPLSVNQSIGSASYQWNNLYAKNYYYNGVAWGLDKANEWTKTQNFVGEYQGTEYSFRYHSCFVLYGTEDTVGKSGMTITKWRPGKNQGALVSTDLIQFGIDVTENEVRTQNVFNIQALGYNSNNGQFNTCTLTSKMTNCNLGSTDNKWTINGLNPGRISLPRYAASVAQDISGNMIPDQYNNIKFTSNLDGWMYIDFNVSSATLLSGADYLVQSKDNSLANATHAINFVRVVGNHIFVYQPVLKNEYIILELNFSGFSIGKAYIYPCQGTII